MRRLGQGTTLYLILALLAFSGLLTAHRGAADASGCSRDFSLGKPSQAADTTPNCAPGGNGCYECAYDHQNQSGYDICAEPVDPSVEGGAICVYGVPNIPSWWPDPIAGQPGPEPPPPGDVNPSGTGDDGGVGPDPGGGGGGGDGGPYYYVSYVPPSYLYPVQPGRPYDPRTP